MTKRLIHLGIILTAFTVIPGMDVRNIKLDIAGMFALAISLSAIYEYGIRPQRNRWLMVFLWVACSSYFIAPKVAVQMFGMDVSLFWTWQPMYYFVVFGLLLFSVSSVPLTAVELSKIIRTITWCGFVMAVYVILQYFRLDQVFAAHTDATYGRMAGFIGNPTHVSPYIAMIVPIALYMRRKTMALVMVTAVCLTTSSVAIGAMVVSLFVYCGLQSRKALRLVILTILLACSVITVLAINDKLPDELVADHERFMIWTDIVKDVKTPQLDGSNQIFPITGMGIGTFKYVFHFQHNNSFQQAHNEFLEILYNLGIVGLGLFLGAIVLWYRRNFKLHHIYNISSRGEYYGLRTALLASMVCIGISACGTFIWQIGTTAFYSIIVVGLVNNRNVGGKNEEVDNGFNNGKSMCNCVCK